MEMFKEEKGVGAAQEHNKATGAGGKVREAVGETGGT